VPYPPHSSLNCCYPTIHKHMHNCIAHAAAHSNQQLLQFTESNNPTKTLQPTCQTTDLNRARSKRPRSQHKAQGHAELLTQHAAARRRVHVHAAKQSKRFGNSTGRSNKAVAWVVCKSVTGPTVLNVWYAPLQPC
jgi:hypothetical protein